MLGNDVVDLADPEARPDALHPRFDARVFEPEERAWLAASPWAERARWALWAAKESAYKALRRIDAGTVFSPRRFRVRLEEGGDGLVGWVGHGGRRLSVSLELGSRFVHAVARLEPWRAGGPLEGVRVLAGTGALAPDAASASVRRLVCDHLAQALGVAPGELRFGRRRGVPELELPGRRAATLSLSHHGRCTAFALVVP